MVGSNRILWVAATCLGMAALLLACGSTQPTGTEPAPDSPAPGTDSAAPADSPLPTAVAGQETRPAEGAPELTAPLVIGQVPAGLLDAILADLAGRLGVRADEIEVIRGESVVWNDGSLGCPQPGMMYTQALVAGYQVILRVGDGTFDYRASESGFFVLCQEKLAPVASPPAQVVNEVTVPTSPTVPTPSSAGLQKLVAEAKEDLALRLSISTEEIDLVELGPVVWPDGSLGCPQPGVEYVQVQQEGLLIRLRVGKRAYPYHSGGGTPPFLCQQAIETEPSQ
jgi:hypothetical protein